MRVRIVVFEREILKTERVDVPHFRVDSHGREGSGVSVTRSPTHLLDELILDELVQGLVEGPIWGDQLLGAGGNPDGIRYVIDIKKSLTDESFLPPKE